MTRKIIVISGPTASGKTDLAIDIAKNIESEIISADSRLVYKDMNIGTAKPSLEEMKNVVHHQIDVTTPDKVYSVGMYQKDTEKIIKKIHAKNKIPIIAGGTGFYIRSLTDKLNIPDVSPDEEYRKSLNNFVNNNGSQALHAQLAIVDIESAIKIHPNDTFRIIRALEIYTKTGKKMSSLVSKDNSDYNILYFCLSFEDRDLLYNRINKRVLSMFDKGLIEEVTFLINKYGHTQTILKTLGYKEVIQYLDKKITVDQCIEEIQKNTRHFARRQLIWFRPDERIKWYHMDTTPPNNIVDEIVEATQKND